MSERPPGAAGSRKDITRIITVLAVGVALAVTVSIPATYFAIAYVSHGATLRTEAEINARVVNRLINANPELWKYEETRLKELLSTRPDGKIRERRTVFDLKGTVIARRSDRLESPVMSVSHVLRDSGRPVGRLEIARSLRPVVVGTGMAALFGCFLGFAVFYTLKLLPLTALRVALASLSREKGRAHVVLQSIRAGIVTADGDGNVVLLNGVAEKMTGWSPSEAAGTPVAEVIRLAVAPRAGQGEGGASGPAPGGRAAYPVLIARDGTERLVEVSVAPIMDGEGRPAGSVQVIRDMEEKVRLDEELLNARKMESLGILAGGIAHNFNNILTGILGNISLAKAGAAPGDRIYRRLEEAEKASGRAKALAIKLLTFAQGGRPVRKLIALEDTLRGSAAPACRGSDVCCELRIAEGLWPVEADAGQIGEVVDNLVLNAFQAMPEGGTVTVDAVNAVVGEETGDVAPGDYVRIDVEDHGVGIPAEDLHRIFDPYYTTRPNGTGLGLTTCYHIVRSHAGSIQVESEPGVRTVFRVYLPASNARACPESPGEKDAVAKGKGRVLVMDDEDLVCDVASGMLEHLGYETALAKDGAEAVAMYARAAESGNPFDAVILDLRVHGGMGGKEAIGKLRDLDAGVRAVVSSAYSSDPVMADHRAYGFAGVVEKPYRIEELGKVLDDVVRRVTPPAA